MKTAVYERPTSPLQPHKIVITLGEGDVREVSIYDAQHLMESLDMALNECIDYKEANG